MTKELIQEHYINQNKSISNICIEFNITKKKFTNFCKKYLITKSKELRNQSIAKSGTETKEIFIEKANKIHNNKYNYSLVEYSYTKNPVKIICPTHGEFTQKPVTHLQGYGCQICGGSKQLTQNDFIEKANKTHNNKYNYSKAIYKNAQSKLIIDCAIHGEFTQKASKHLFGQGCPHCANNVKSSLEKFIEKAKLKHGEIYDYSKTEYDGTDTKTIFICPIHGDFETTPYLHLKHGCLECSIQEPGNKQYQDTFIENSNKIHNNKYDYSQVDYFNAITYVKIVCPIHGVFEQAPYDHRQGKGCSKCANNIKFTTQEFIQQANETHKNKYDYSLSNYIVSHEKVKIICYKHGVFEQDAVFHKSGQGCPKCATYISKAHQEIGDFIQSKISNEVLFNDRLKINPLELDLLIPDLNLGIEYHGSYWHSYNRPETPKEKNKHKAKQDLAESNNLKLLQIFEHEWLNKKELIKSKIVSVLGKCGRLYARKCEIREIDSLSFNNFCISNHIQGKLDSGIRYGLFCDGLVSVIGFNKVNDVYECTRFCSSLNRTIIGGAEKLFKKFVGDYKPKQVITFADRRFSRGDIYKRLGFSFLYNTSPCYFYWKSGVIYNRRKFMKHKLEKQLELFDKNLTEHENMFNNGFRRFWDAGHSKFMIQF